MHGSWSFKKHVLKVLKWSPDFTADHEPPVAPVWIYFNHLPIHLFQKGPLMFLASLLGRPLRIDTATHTLSLPSVARVCVELNLLRHLPNCIWIGHGDSGIWQAVTYDNLPLTILVRVWDIRMAIVTLLSNLSHNHKFGNQKPNP